MSEESVLPSTPKAARQSYRGVPAEERRAQRRELLIQAAIAVYGRVGFHNASIKAVCDAANLTERYFYESFESSQELLAAAFEAVTGQLRACLLDAAERVNQPGKDRAAAILTEYFEALQKDSPSARVFLVEANGVSSEVEKALSQALITFADLLEVAWGTPPTPSGTMLKIGLAGGLVRMATTWVTAGYDRPVAELVDAAVELSRVLSPRRKRS